MLARARQRAIKTASRFKQKVGHFVRWAGAALPVSSISDSTLLDYHGQLCEEIAVGKRTAGGAQDQLRAVTHFIRTAFCPRGTLEALPRVLQVARSPLVFEDVEERESRRDTANWFDDLDTLKRIIKASPDRLRLWLYLMLNCAFPADRRVRACQGRDRLEDPTNQGLQITKGETQEKRPTGHLPTLAGDFSIVGQ